MTHVWEHSKQEGGALLVLLALADYCNDRGESYPSIKTLARKSRLGERQTQRVVQQLEEAGEIAVLKNGGPNGVNIYRINKGGDKMSGVTSPQREGESPMSPKPSLEPSGKTSMEVFDQEEKSPPLVLMGERLNGAKRHKDDLFTDLLPPDWIPNMKFACAWQGFVEHRRALKSTLTDHAVRMIITKLRGFHETHGIAGVIASLNQTVENGKWTGVFEPRDIPQKANGKTANLQPPDGWSDFIATHPVENFRRKYGNYLTLQPHIRDTVISEFRRWSKTGRHDA